MNTAYQKDIWRSVRKGWKRFLSILAITALGVGMLTGLYAACQDMYHSADRFFDEQNLFDIRVLSTLGLTQEDVEVLSQVEGVAAAEGAYLETVHTQVGGLRKSAQMVVLSEGGLNLPYLLSGALPARPGEIAVTKNYLQQSGKALGDTLTIAEDLGEDQSAEEAKAEDEDAIDLDMEVEIEEEEEPTFLHTVYTIAGVVMDPRDIRGEGQANAFRSTADTDYTFFICGQDAKTEVFSVVYIALEGTEELSAFGDAYEDAVRRVIGDIESRIKAQRTQARYQAVVREARLKIADAETTMQEKFAEADAKFADAWQEIDDAKQDLTEGEATLTKEEREARQKINEAWDEILDGKLELADAEKELWESLQELVDGEAELEENAQKLEEGKAQLAEESKKAEDQLAEAEKQLEAAQAELDAGRARLEAAIAQLQAPFGSDWPQAEWNALVEAAATPTQSGADDAAFAQGTAAQSAALGAALQARVNAMQAGLAQEESRLQAQLMDARQGAAALAAALEDAAGQARALEGVRDEKQAAFLAAQEALAALEDSGEPDQAAIAAQAEAVAKAAGELSAAQASLDSANEAVFGLQGRLAALNSQIGQLEEGLHTLQTQGAQLSGLPAAAVQAAIGLGQAEGGQRLLAEQKAAFSIQKEEALAQLAAAWAELADGEAQLAKGRETLAEGKAEWQEGYHTFLDGKAELEEGEAELITQEADAKKKIAEGWREIADGRDEWAKGRRELLDKEAEYADKKSEAHQKLADARAEVDDIDMTQWYVQDRAALDSYATLSSDLSSIEAVGRVFPVIFLVVAVLISLTTMTRMVEEERGLIGLYKALGFTDGSVYGRYILFAAGACLLGGALGDVFGFVFMPKFVVLVLEELYHLPHYYLRFDTLYGVGGVVLFMAGILGATALACRSELAQMPAALMRPKAPRAGSRVLLERIPAIWNRLKFLNKVTVRNLFRYKKRLFMTVGGIMGCTALILCGFAIKDSIADLNPKQYDNIYRYDLMAVFEEADNAARMDGLSRDSNIADSINLRIESVKLINGAGESEKVQLMAVAPDAAFGDYIRLETPAGSLAKLGNEGAIITQNAAQLYDLSIGDTIFVQNLDLVQKEVPIAGIVRNYMGNNIYMTEGLYKSLFNEYQPNAVLAHLSAACLDHSAYVDGLIEEEGVISAVSKTALKESFGFELVNALVLLITAMAGGLAFAVLFTLSNTNISERVRELSTIKVLGFYDGEVHQYVNKETLILTLVGILLGLPLGRFISGFLTYALNMPSIYFAVYIRPVSYLISGAITLGFALLVNVMTNRALNRIDMVEALKSVE